MKTWLNDKSKVDASFPRWTSRCDLHRHHCPRRRPQPPQRQGAANHSYGKPPPPGCRIVPTVVVHDDTRTIAKDDRFYRSGKAILKRFEEAFPKWWKITDTAIKQMHKKRLGDIEKTCLAAFDANFEFDLTMCLKHCAEGCVDGKLDVPLE